MNKIRRGTIRTKGLKRAEIRDWLISKGFRKQPARKIPGKEGWIKYIGPSKRIHIYYSVKGKGLSWHFDNH